MPATTDALWALAPEDTEFGVVFAANTGSMLESAWKEFSRSFTYRPGGEALHDEFIAYMPMSIQIPAELSDADIRRQKGIDIARPAALFVLDQDKLVLVLPVADRRVFARNFGRGARKIAGISYDQTEFRDMLCTERAGFYVCSDDVANLAGVGKSNAMKERIARRPAHLRGHVETWAGNSFIRRLGQSESLFALFGDASGLEAAVQLKRGGLTARAHFTGKPAHSLLTALATVPKTLATRAARSDPVGITRVRVPLTKLVPFDQLASILTPVAKAADVDAKADIYDNLTGELVIRPPPGGKHGIAIEFGLVDSKRLSSASKAICDYGRAEAPPGIRFVLQDGRCLTTLPPEVVNALGGAGAFERPLALSFAIDDAALVVTAWVDDQVPERHGEPHPVSRELIDKDWNYAAWGYGTLISSLDPALLSAAAGEPEGEAATFIGIWSLAHLTELGIGAGVRDDGVHALVHLGTQWANPDDVLRPFQAELGALLGGDLEARARLSSLAKKSPESALGRSFAIGPVGFHVAMIGSGMLAGFAYPSFESLLHPGSM